RRAALVGALARRGVEAHGRSGMNVWVPVPDETGAVARLLQSGWAVAPGARFRLESGPAVRITVSEVGTSEVEGSEVEGSEVEGAEVERLAEAVAAAVAPVAPRTYG
ncbi:hypothetical protein ABZ945_32810, partial [Streptomyces sp. NPDC046887]